MSRPLSFALCAVLASSGLLAFAGPAAAACRNDDAACFQAEARALEAEADRLLQGLPAQAPPPRAQAQPRYTPPAPTPRPAQAPRPVAAAGGGGGLANGEYDCGGGYTYRAMGKVDIQNGRFRYRPYEDVVNGFAPYSVQGAQVVWGGPFGGLDEAPARIVSTTVEPFGFNVNYQGSPGALTNTMSCHAPGR